LPRIEGDARSTARPSSADRLSRAVVEALDDGVLVTDTELRPVS